MSIRLEAILFISLMLCLQLLIKQKTLPYLIVMAVCYPLPYVVYLAQMYRSYWNPGVFDAVGYNLSYWEGTRRITL